MWVPSVVVAPGVAHGEAAEGDMAAVVDLLTIRLAESGVCAVSDAQAANLAGDELAEWSSDAGVASGIDFWIECSGIRRNDGLTLVARLRPADGSPMRGALACVPPGDSLEAAVATLCRELEADLASCALRRAESGRAAAAALAERLRAVAARLPREAFALRFAEHFERDMALRAGTADVAATKVLVEAGQSVVPVETTDAPEAAERTLLEGVARCRIAGRAAGRVLARATCSLRLTSRDPDLPSVETTVSHTVAGTSTLEAGHAALDAAGAACALELLERYARVLATAAGKPAGPRSEVAEKVPGTLVELRISPLGRSPEIDAVADAAVVVLSKMEGVSVLDARRAPESAGTTVPHAVRIGAAAPGMIAYLERSGATVLVSVLRVADGSLAGLGRVGLQRAVQDSARAIANVVGAASRGVAVAGQPKVGYYFDCAVPPDDRHAALAWGGLAALARVPGIAVLPRDRLTVVSRVPSAAEEAADPALPPADAILVASAAEARSADASDIAVDLELRPADGSAFRTNSVLLRAGQDPVAAWTAVAGWLSESLAVRPPPADRARAGRETTLLRQRAEARGAAGQPVEQYHANKLLAWVEPAARNDCAALLRTQGDAPGAMIAKAGRDARAQAWADDCLDALVDRCSRAEDWYRIYPVAFPDDRVAAIPSLSSMRAFEPFVGKTGRMDAVERLLAARVARLRWYHRKRWAPQSLGEDSLILIHVWSFSGRDVAPTRAEQYARAYLDAYLPVDAAPRAMVGVLARSVDALSNGAGPAARARLAEVLRESSLPARLASDMPEIPRLLDGDVTPEVIAELRRLVTVREQAFRAQDAAEREIQSGRFRTRPKPEGHAASPVLPPCFAPIPPEFAAWFPERAGVPGPDTATQAEGRSP